MRLRKTLLATAACALTLLSSATLLAAKPGWIENFDEAQKLALSQKKHVLIDFTGSDWCGYCIRLDRDVFAKPDFKEFGEKSLVLLEIDFPKGKPQPPELVKQNESLGRKFKVEGYPTLVLLSPEGKEVKRWVGGGEAFFSELKAAVSKNADASKK